MGQWIPWLPAYEVKISEIDEQHRELFRIYNDILDAMWDGKGKSSVQEKMQVLVNHAVTNFTTEENYMIRYNFPNYAIHKKAHDDFASGIVNFLKSYELEGVKTDTLVSVVQDLGSWTRDHIRDMDQEVGKFLGNRQSTEVRAFQNL
jgi:hemerythrin-like metal-binding protein